MADQEKAAKRGAPRGPKQRVITFVVSVEGMVKLVKARTNACSVDDAWKELNMPDSATNCGAIQGHHDFITNPVLRKPTYEELMQKAGLAK